MGRVFNGSERGVVLSVLELSDEPPFVDFSIAQFVAEGGQAQSLELLGADAFLLGRIRHVIVLIHALHHCVKLLEVVGMEGQLWVNVLGHLHHVGRVQGAFGAGSLEVVGRANRFVLEEVVENASLLL